ncbi:MAG: exodeoxyribonuclease V subunit gamma [Desulfuromonadales bacterium]|nr:MAG: exodeoxyribonuclease V subunit gamma [Desulfuromonadales bacterium]
MALSIYTGNRMETLVNRLAAVVAVPLRSPLERETIVVQSGGMERWVAMELARRFGVWANADYPFPNAMVWGIFRAVVPELPPGPDASPFAPEVLRWRIVGLLSSLAGQGPFAPLRGYLADDGDGLKLFQLAGTIADTFDQYSLFRPDMLLAWERGEGTEWQAILWRELAAGSPGLHRAALLKAFRRGIARGAVDTARLPARISLVGIPALPPFHLEVLAGIAPWMEVNLFLLNPCREYWGKIVSERERARLERRVWNGAELDGYFETGNPLLASLGKMGRDFFECLLSGCADALLAEEFADVPEESLLAAIQADILLLRDRETTGEPTAVDSRDGSLRLHSCHTPLREVEVLHDAILALFADDPTLTPRDILVMTPDIEAYAPYISAVFGSPEAPDLKIPYSIADRSLRREGNIAEALLAILRLATSRTTAADLLDLLAMPPVARRFGFGERELETAGGWVRDAAIRWGIDAPDRQEHGVPPFAENSWRSGLDRLLLGYAMAGERDGRFFGGILPLDRVEGGDALVLGRFLAFAEGLFARLRELRHPRPLGDWVTLLRELLAEFTVPDGAGERERATVGEVFDQLDAARLLAQFAGEVRLEPVRAWLDEQLSDAGRGLGFLSGGVTFCAMLPMRSIPFRVIALLGMNDGVFPRRNPPPGFNLVARSPRPGDRSLRDEDRYLFLEAILSARQRFHISYVGQGVRDGGELPPSVLVSELLDYVQRCFVPAGGGTGDDLLRSLLVKHRLQPFSPDYFRGDGTGPLFSYSRENCAGVMARSAGLGEMSPFIAAPLLLPADLETVTLADLADFLGNPARHFLRRRLGVFLDREEDPLADCEPFLPDPLERYRLDQEIVAALLEGEDPDRHRSILRGRGWLPPGAIGDAVYHGRLEEARGFAVDVLETVAGEAMPALEIDRELGGLRLLGRIAAIGPAGLVRYRFARVKARDRLRAWLEHLALNAEASEGYPRTTLLFGSDATVTFAPMGGAAGELARLIALYRRGMATPLRFFPETSLEYAKKANDPKKAHRALDDARKTWHGSEEYPGEEGDPACRRCFGDGEPLDGDFATVALAVYGALLTCQTEQKRK